jgi:glycosyltransferase involved in cell wall biosynthesis
MANRLPVISSNIGGIPEILEKGYLFEVGDFFSMTTKIIELISKPLELQRIINLNYEKSLEFVESKNSRKRQNYYKKIKSFVSHL